jgi:hypothetical protein
MSILDCLRSKRIWLQAIIATAILMAVIIALGCTG